MASCYSILCSILCFTCSEQIQSFCCCFHAVLLWNCSGVHFTVQVLCNGVCLVILFGYVLCNTCASCLYCFSIVINMNVFSVCFWHVVGTDRDGWKFCKAWFLCSMRRGLDKEALRMLPGCCLTRMGWTGCVPAVCWSTGRTLLFALT